MIIVCRNYQNLQTHNTFQILISVVSIAGTTRTYKHEPCEPSNAKPNPCQLQELPEPTNTRFGCELQNVFHLCQLQELPEPTNTRTITLPGSPTSSVNCRNSQNLQTHHETQTTANQRHTAQLSSDAKTSHQKQQTQHQKTAITHCLPTASRDPSNNQTTEALEDFKEHHSPKQEL